MAQPWKISAGAGLSGHGRAQRLCARELPAPGDRKKTLREAIARAPQLKLQTLVGLIFAQNEPSIELFRAVTFEHWGLLPGVARVDQQARELAISGRPI